MIASDYKLWIVPESIAERAGSFEPCAVVAALEGSDSLPGIDSAANKGFVFDGMGNGKTLYRAEDHQCFKDVLVVRGNQNPTSQFDLLEVVQEVPRSQVEYDPSIFGGELGPYEV